MSYQEKIIKELIDIAIKTYKNKKNKIDKNIIDPLLTNIFIKIRPYIILLTIFIMSSLALMVSVIMLITSSNN
jgi:hypothetical protein